MVKNQFLKWEKALKMQFPIFFAWTSLNFLAHCDFNEKNQFPGFFFCVQTDSLTFIKFFFLQSLLKTYECNENALKIPLITSKHSGLENLKKSRPKKS